MLREEVCDAIYMVIPEVPRLVRLFHTWSNLDAISKIHLDREAELWTCPKKLELYLALTDAFTKWENVQATEGAPGCDPQSFDFSTNAQLEQELLGMIQYLEDMVNLCTDNNSSNHRQMRIRGKEENYMEKTKRKYSSEQFFVNESHGDHSGYKTE